MHILNYFVKKTTILGSEYPNPMHEARLTFDLSSVSLHGVTLLMSEFHIYKWPLPEMRSVSKPCLITVYAPTFIDGYVTNDLFLNVFEKCYSNDLLKN